MSIYDPIDSPVSFVVGNGPATLTGGTNITFTGAGSVSITASQSGDSMWNNAPSVTNTFTVTKLPATVTLNGLAQTYDGTPRLVMASTIPPGLGTNITYNGLAWAPTNVGNYAVTGTVNDAMYQGATNGTLVVAQAQQTVTFPTILPQRPTSTVGLTATASSQLPVVFNVTGGPGTITDGTNLFFTGVGDVRVVVSQSGNANYNAAPDATQFVKVYQVSPSTGPFAGGNTVTITNGALGNGSDITSVLVGGTEVVRTGQGANWVTLTMPTNATVGMKDIVIQSTSVGGTTFAGAYTVNPPGQIIGATLSDWAEVAGLPAARYGLAAGVLNGSLYAVGGYGAGGIQTNVYRYNGTNWTQVTGLPAPCYGLAAGVLNGFLYAVGGYGTGGIQTNVYRYNGTNWMQVAGLPTPRDFLAAGVLNGALYAVGGWDGSGAQTNVYRYNGTNWTEVAGLPAPFYGLAAGVLNGSMYAFGGNGPGGAQTNVYRFDGTNWMEVSGLPAAHDALAAGALNGAVYSVGGNVSTNVYAYNETAWTEVAGLPVARSYLAAAVLNGSLYAIGGTDGSVTRTNVYRYPHIAGNLPGVNPTSGSYTGGYAVVIIGSNLCDGADITNVTLCGVSTASIVSRSATQIVVTTGPATPAGLGFVRVYSTSFGVTSKSNAFSYNPAITVVAGAHGMVAPSGMVDVAYGGNTSLVVSADAYYHIGSMVTNGANVGAAANKGTYTSTWMNVTVTGLLTAAFAENLTTNTATPQWWLAQYNWTNDFEAAATNDTDGDGMPAWAEYVAGTDPTNGDSRLSVVAISNAIPPSATNIVVQWLSVSNKTYRLERSTNLVSTPPFDFNVRTNIPATPPLNTETDTTATGQGPYFYRIGVQ